MIQDQQLTFSGIVGADGQRSAQAIPGNALGTNVLDVRGLAPAGDESPFDASLFLVVQVAQGFNNLTSLTVFFETGSTSALGTAHASITVPLSALTAGARIWTTQLPSGQYGRYAGLRYVVNGTAPTAGSVNAFMTPTAGAAPRNYPSAVTLDV